MNQQKIGKFIAECRKNKKMTQAELAEKLGVTDRSVSKWENGRCMPDLSLFEPLCEELDISINELLSGERIRKEEYQEKLEQNLVSTIDYSNKQIEKVKSQVSYIIMIVGILVAICSVIMFDSESSWGSIYSIIGMVVFAVGLFKTLKSKNVYKKIGISILTFIVIFSLFFIVDMISVCSFKRPPMYRYKTITDFGTSKVITYDSVFYSVYRINADTKNEYYIIDIGKKKTENSIPITPFNRDKSGIDNIIQYKNKYLGNHSNTNNLVTSLPLSQYGSSIEIDQDKLTIYYNTTTWYQDELYIHKALIYNSISIFMLIDNVNEIEYHFSGDSFSINREMIEQYPHYSFINKDNFNEYVEEKMNDEEFIETIFKQIFKEQE